MTARDTNAAAQKSLDSIEWASWTEGESFTGLKERYSRRSESVNDSRTGCPKVVNRVAARSESESRMRLLFRLLRRRSLVFIFFLIFFLVLD